MTLDLQLADSTADSFLARWDTRWKLVSLVIALVVFTAVQTIVVAAILDVGLIVLTLVAGTRRASILSRFVGFAAFFALALGVLPLATAITVPAEHRGQAIVASVAWIAILLLRTSGMTLSILLVTATSPPGRIAAAAHGLRLPKLVIRLTSLAHRYAFLLVDQYRRLRVALLVRGFRPSSSSRRWRVAAHVLGALLVRSHDRGERVAQAMQCRGFDGSFHSLASSRTSASDVVLFAVATSLAIAAVVADSWLRSAIP